MFRKGDKLKCVDIKGSGSSELKLGDIYTVINSIGSIVYVKNQNGKHLMGYYHYRFELANEVPSTLEKISEVIEKIAEYGVKVEVRLRPSKEIGVFRNGRLLFGYRTYEGALEKLETLLNSLRVINVDVDKNHIAEVSCNGVTIGNRIIQFEVMDKIVAAMESIRPKNKES